MGDEQILTGLICSIREDPQGDPQADPVMERCEGDKPRPRFEKINREQMVMRAIDVEQLV